MREKSCGSWKGICEGSPGYLNAIIFERCLSLALIHLLFNFSFFFFFFQAAHAGTQIALPLMVQEKNDRALENEDN